MATRAGCKSRSGVMNGQTCTQCGSPMIPVQGTSTWICPQCADGRLVLSKKKAAFPWWEDGPFLSRPL